MFKVANHSIYTHPLPEGHRFPMEKYDLLPKQLLHEGTCASEDFLEAHFAEDEAILAVHDHKYYEDLVNLRLSRKAEIKTGFPLSETLVDRERIIVGGTIMAAKFALEDAIAMNIAGGTHHAYSDHGEGFCLLNDQAVAARYLQQKKLMKKVLFVDLDVHQGNGTAEIFKNDPSVFTFSMHGKNNYPFDKEKSDLDIELPDGTTDTTYLRILKSTLPKLLEEQQPDFIFYQCGVDILSTDKLGKLNCSVQGCKERDRFVLQTCYDLQIPVQCSMGGGYSPEIRMILEAHANTFRLAREIY